MNMRHTLNGKHIVGMGIIALAVVVLTSKLAWGLFPLLFIIVCPLMMFLMMRGMGSMGANRNPTPPTETRQSSMLEGTPEERLTKLKARNELPARPIAPIQAEDILPHESALATPPAGAIPQNRTDVTA